MALDYASSNIAAGNSLFGATAGETLTVWGMTFVQANRFLLVLVRLSSGSLVWKKIDPLTLTTVGYDMTFTPTVAGIDASDRSASKQGQFLQSDDTHLFYLKGNVIHRRSYLTGAASGSHTLNNATGTGLNAVNLDGIVYSGAGGALYVYSKTDGKVYRYASSQLTWSGSAINASSTATETLFTTLLPRGGFVQPITNDVVFLFADSAGNSRFGSKYTADLLTRKGVTDYEFTSANVVAAEFRGSILYLLACDNLVAGSGLYIYRYGDASTGQVSTFQTDLYVDKDRVKVGSNEIIRVVYSARDGYGEKFQPTEFVRFSLLKVGDEFDADDLALSPTNNANSFRNSQNEPVNTVLDIPFDLNGEATCYLHTPLEIPRSVLLYRVRAKYPIN